MASSCLVTSTPDFVPPKKTRPFLIEATAFPDPRAVLTVDSLDISQGKAFFEFDADVVSNDEGEPVFFQLYLDYGTTNVVGQPFLAPISNFKKLDPGTMDDAKPRRITAKWFPNNNAVGFGCHTVTLIASHHFDPVTGCPECRNDSTQITWPVFRCDSSNPDQPCSLDFSKCKGWTDTCHPSADPDAGASCGASP